MNLIAHRDQWAQAFKDGAEPSFMKTYRGSRNSETWRGSSLVEELCEYIMYLEGRLDD